MFGLFFKKRYIEEIKEETKKGFESVKKDITSVSGWINHLDSEKKIHKKDIEEMPISLQKEVYKRHYLEITRSFINNKNINFQQDLDFPELFQVPFNKKSLIIKSKWYKSGNLIFQDKSSLAVVHVLAPQPTDIVCDMCAAPGLKTSLIAQNTNDQAKIIAGEFLTERINQTKKICLAAMKQNGFTLYLVINQTTEICLEALNQNINSIEYIDIKKFPLIYEKYQFMIL